MDANISTGGLFRNPSNSELREGTRKMLELCTAAREQIIVLEAFASCLVVRVTDSPFLVTPKRFLVTQPREASCPALVLAKRLDPMKHSGLLRQFTA